MVLAAVVSWLDSTKSVRQPAYATPTNAPCQVHPRRAAGVMNQSATAATPERKLAICQPVSAAALIAAPPVENRKAAPRSCKRAMERDVMERKVRDGRTGGQAVGRSDGRKRATLHEANGPQLQGPEPAPGHPPCRRERHHITPGELSPYLQGLRLSSLDFRL